METVGLCKEVESNDKVIFDYNAGYTLLEELCLAGQLTSIGPGDEPILCDEGWMASSYRSSMELFEEHMKTLEMDCNTTTPGRVILLRIMSFLRFGYEVSFEALDKGAIEILGPYGQDLYRGSNAL
ncbi:hypothetical protein L1987_45810 [Smallanthus sonchifolius]|uniref:Uncharacterized protein n=1 Tax=Smallanthus sonchifolius TaxID=185202 RepID=A0ACB9FZ04_9ASTR|nr:hypothetical protein L1987_45810 [Smallanthus sonchifolius]